MFGKKKNTPATTNKKPLWKKLLKWTGISFLLLLLFILAAPFLFQKQIFEYIKNEINNNLNANFECADYSLTLFSTFPNFTVELNNIKLSGMNEFEGVDLFKTEKMLLTLDIKSVLFGDKIDIKKIGLVNTDIHAIVLENGKANWDIAKADTTTIEVDTAKKEPSKFAVKLREYYVENANIRYDDYAGNTHARIVNLTHRGKGDFTQDIFDFTTTTTADTIDVKSAGITYMKNTRADIKIDLGMDMPNMKFTFKDNLVKLNELELGFDGWLAMPDENMNMDITFESKKTDFRNIFSMIPAAYTSDFASIKFGGNFGLKGFVKGTMSANSFPAFDIDANIDNGSFKYPDLPRAATDIFVNIKATGKGNPSMDDIVVDVSRFNVNLAGNTVRANLNLSYPISDPAIRSEIFAQINLATLKEVIPVSEGEQYNGTIDADVKLKGRMSSIEKEEYEKFEAAGKILAQNIVYKSSDLPYETQLKLMEFNFSPKYLELAKLEAKIDKSELAANGKIDNYLSYLFKNENLHGVFNVSSPYLNLADFTSAESSAGVAETNAAKETAPTTADESASYIIELPKNIDFQMSTRVGKIIYPNTPGKPDIELNNFIGNITLREGKAMMEALKFNTLDGSVNMSGTYSPVSSNEALIDFAYSIMNMDIKKSAETFNTIERFAPLASKCTGKFSTTLQYFKATLNKNLEPDYNSLSGKGTFTTKNIYIEGFEPINKLAEKLKIQKLAKQNIQDVNFVYEFKDGRIWIEPYTVKLSGINTKVQGSTGFDQSLDYKLEMEIPRSEFGGQANAVLNDLTAKAKQASGMDVSLGDKINVVAFVKGTATNPKIETNLKEQLNNAKDDVKEAIKEKVEEKVEEVKKEVKEKVSEQAEKLIKDAEAKAEQIKAEAKKNADKIRSESKTAANKIREEAKNAGQKLITEAGGNPLKKIAAEKSAQKLEKEAEEKAQKLEAEGEEKAKKLEDEANEKANKIIEDARKEAEKLK
jgi:hypothetical protein